MKTIIKISYDELLEQLSLSENVETVDLGAVSLHLVTLGSALHLLVENPTNENESAMVVLEA